jgi:hypothetical protein
MHLPLAAVLQPFLDGPLRLDTIEEHSDEDEAYPRRIALRAQRAS